MRNGELQKHGFGHHPTSQDDAMEVGIFEAGNPKNMLVWRRNYRPPRTTKQGAGSFRRLPWGYELTNCGIRTSIDLWEKGTKYYDKEKYHACYYAI